MLLYKRGMGIPSYFRRILQRYPGTLSSERPSASVLCFDFNCLIYRCLRSPSLRPYPSDLEDQDLWQKEFLNEICSCVKDVWQEAGKPKRVFIAVDGVVPMAKIRQQRVRRFKSAWLRANSTGFDSNALTPGTEFMDKLGYKLEEMAGKHVGWEVSGVRERGEGEHKLLRWLRKHSITEPTIVYGLDADLILLSMLVSEELKSSLWLMREKQEFGKEKSKTEKQEYQFLNLNEFKIRLGLESKEDVIQYIALMNLMGNDFLPHSITHKLNDDGHDYVLKELKRGIKLVDENGKLILDVLKEIFMRWSEDEEDKMKYMILKKRDQAKRGVLQGMEEQEGLPLEWNVEKAIMPEKELVPEWRSVYWNWIHPTAGKSQCKRVCEEYVYGCQWVLDYYAGKEVDVHWSFPSWLPPLWSDLLTNAAFISRPMSKEAPPEPEEQLAMVLPLASWGLIRNKDLRLLPSLAPHLWPTSFSFFSVGRKWLWECEALIPPLTAGRLREILNENKQ